LKNYIKFGSSMTTYEKGSELQETFSYWSK